MGTERCSWAEHELLSCCQQQRDLTAFQSKFGLFSPLHPMVLLPWLCPSISAFPRTFPPPLSLGSANFYGTHQTTITSSSHSPAHP